MARRDIIMNEIVEIIYQWHKGYTIKGSKDLSNLMES